MKGLNFFEKVNDVITHMFYDDNPNVLLKDGYQRTK
jgi:hypothetical protein